MAAGRIGILTVFPSSRPASAKFELRCHGAQRRKCYAAYNVLPRDVGKRSTIACVAGLRARGSNIDSTIRIVALRVSDREKSRCTVSGRGEAYSEVPKYIVFSYPCFAETLALRQLIKGI